ncbi:amphoterin-induced protein 2 [Empidonax traillii]|uniref:amphoterin-induced protein 2 n=1 Tax=Empidonax traillii TaxID=164674 RepID=UPI000FFD9940|nr:amphoterin-induced protein 2 [Empidonax traillii]XP_027748721.1 amphoterin-induced protein 2 [Empidonax traillii]
MSLNRRRIPTRLGVFKVNCKGLTCLLVFTVSICGSTPGMCPTACICASDIISCTNKNLSRVPGNLYKCMKRLDLSYNKIGLLEPEWVPVLFEKLNTLIVDHNSISSIITGSFSTTPNLKYLDLSSNSLKTLGSPVFQELKALEVLLLYNNQITQIDSLAFGGLYNLQKLYLSYNLLSNFPLDLYVGKHKLTDLALLDVSFNRIRLMPIQRLSSVPAKQLSGIYLHGNPFYCDCLLYSMLIFWYQRQFSSVVDFKNEYSCLLQSDPKGHNKLPLLLDNFLNCSESTVNSSFQAFGFIHDAQVGDRLIVHCDSRISDVGTHFVWVSPDNRLLEPDRETNNFKVFPNGSLEITDAQLENSGLYSCIAINKKRLLNETIEVRINVSNFTMNRSHAHEAFNTAFTTLAACVASIILVLLYLYLTPCPCQCKAKKKKRKLNQGSAHSSILNSAVPQELNSTMPADEKKASTGKRVAFLEPVHEPKHSQNGKVKLFPNDSIITESILKTTRTKSDSDSVNSVFSDTPFMPPT